MICSPLTLLQCCPTGDGAAALVLASNDWAKKSSGKPIRLAAVVLRSGTRLGSRDMTSSDLTRRTSTAAYELAGVGPRDIDVCELHDCFTAAELFHYENLGFCPKGEGGRFIDEGRSGIEGDVAVNPSGGLLAKGHSLGATGIAQMAEIFGQLRGEAGKRQRKDARVGMTHTMGGAATGIDGASCAVSILMK